MHVTDPCALAAVLALSLVRGSASVELNVGVVEPDPARALQLTTSARAALAETGAVHMAPVEPDEPLSAPAQVCELAEGGAALAVCGGSVAALAGEAAARAGLALLVPDATTTDGGRETLALYPHAKAMARVCAELCAAKGWQRAVLLHEGAAVGAPLLAPDAEPLALVARLLPPAAEPALLRNLLLVLKKQGSSNFIVWCSAECCARVLDEAQRVGLLGPRHSYLLLALDLHTQPLTAYSHGGANLTALQLFDPNATHVRDMAATYSRQLPGSEPLSVALHLTHQGVALAAEALRRLRLPPAPAADCAAGAAAFHADTLLNYLRSEEWACPEGAGGEVSWEEDGGRHEVRLQVVEVARGGQLERAGRWAPSAGITWQRSPVPAPPLPLDSMVNRTFTVLVAQNKPYVMRQQSTLRLFGNNRYEGFCIELIEKLAEILSFNYTFVEQADGEYGTYNNVTNKWNGMLGRLIEDPDIDFAVTDLTITSEREKAVDFTTPFMNLGISILYRKPEPPQPQLLAFLLPFSNDVWISLGFAYLLTSLVLYVVGRLCHEEWQNPYPCVEEPVALENQFTLANALWFNLGAVLLQGSEIAPVAYGTRAVASAWWLFALVITSSYTANLATLLGSKSPTEEIRNVYDLANNNMGINYGAKAGGSTYTFFKVNCVRCAFTKYAWKQQCLAEEDTVACADYVTDVNSQNELYHKMYEHMSQQEMPKSNDLAILKVESEKFAFLSESTSIDYVVERNCKLTKVGDLLDSKGYGIAMKKDSPFRHALNLALLNLQEAGTLRDMTRTWWEERNGGGACKDDEEFENQELRMNNFLGLFLVLAVGSALGVIVSCCDLAWAAHKREVQPPASYAARFWAELRFVFRFEESVKPLQGPLIRSVQRSSSTAAESACASPARDGEPELEEEGSRDVRSWSRRRSSMHAANARLARHAPSPRGGARAAY